APCTASASSSTTIASVTVSSPNPDQLLAAGLGGVSFSCAGPYQRVSDPFTFDVFSATGAPQPGALFNVSLQIDKSAVQSSGRTGASQWEICYASTQPFTAVAGTSGTVTIGGTSYNTGLLPDCSNTQDAPCVQARNKTNAGDVVVTFLATGDPFGWA